MLLIGKDSCKSEVYMKYIGNKYGGVDEIYKYIYAHFQRFTLRVLCVYVC